MVLKQFSLGLGIESRESWSSLGHRVFFQKLTLKKVNTENLLVIQFNSKESVNSYH